MLRRESPQGKEIDMNVAMLSVARTLKPVSGARIRWRRGDAEHLPRLNAPFDFVLCHQGFQLCVDRRRTHASCNVLISRDNFVLATDNQAALKWKPMRAPDGISPVIDGP